MYPGVSKYSELSARKRKFVEQPTCNTDYESLEGVHDVKRACPNAKVR